MFMIFTAFSQKQIALTEVAFATSISAVACLLTLNLYYLLALLSRDRGSRDALPHFVDIFDTSGE